MLERFRYRPKSAKTKAEEIVLPWAKDALTAGFIRRHRKTADADEMGWLMLEAVADEDTLSKIDNLTLAEFADFMTAWQGQPEGEEGPSAGES